MTAVPYSCINASDAPAPSGGYAQAVEVTGARRTVYVSGQVPVAVDGIVPATFEEQARLAWQNIEAQLRAANMTLDNIVRHTTYLADRKWRDTNGSVRREVLGDRSPALTVIIAGTFDEGWLLEIECVAVD